jgi:hypothetical protein
MQRPRKWRLSAIGHPQADRMMPDTGEFGPIVATSQTWKS